MFLYSFHLLCTDLNFIFLNLKPRSCTKCGSKFVIGLEFFLLLLNKAKLGTLPFFINWLCLLFPLYGHAGLCYLTFEAQPIMVDP